MGITIHLARMNCSFVVFTLFFPRSVCWPVSDTYAVEFRTLHVDTIIIFNGNSVFFGVSPFFLLVKLVNIF